MKKAGKLIWGLVLVALGALFALNALDVMRDWMPAFEADKLSANW